jgi:hypothetical protein
MLFTIGRWVLGIMIVVWIVHNPTEAGSTLKGWFDGAATFVSSLAS